MTDFYTATAIPATNAQGSSAVVRAEYAAIEAGFAKVAPYTSNGGKAVFINPGGTAQETVTATGTGNAVRATSPTLVTPLLGTPTSGVLTNCTGLPAGTGISGLGASVAAALAIAVGSAGAIVVNGGVLGTPSSGTLSNCTGLPVGTGISGLGANVAAALAIAVGSAGAIVVNGGVLGTPSSGTLSNCTGLPVSTGISGLAAGVATFLATPNSANLLAAMTDETGTGANVFATSPTLVTPLLGTPTSGTLTACTGLPISTGVSGLAAGIATFLATPSSANLIAAVTDETGTGALVFANTPALVTPNIGSATGASLALSLHLFADGANTAMGGAVNVPYASPVSSRNSANSGDLQLIFAATRNARVDVVHVAVGTGQAGCIFKGISAAGTPSGGTDLGAQEFTLWKDTSGGSVKLYYNDGGTLKSVTLT